MKKLLCFGGVTGAYGYHVVNKKNKENVVLNVDATLLDGNKYYPQLWFLSKITNLSIFANNNNIYGGNDLNNLYANTNLKLFPACDDKYVIETAATVALIMTVNDQNANKFNNMFDLANKTYYLPIKNDGSNHKQNLAKLCCALFFNGVRNDATNAVGKLF